MNRLPIRRYWLLGGALASALVLGAAAPACDKVLALGDYQTGPCSTFGEKGCSPENTPRSCGADGLWVDHRCEGGAPQVCDGKGGITTSPVCPEGHACLESTGRCAATAVDLLLVVDNSAQMADKQQVLAAAIPEFIVRLANPLCVDEKGLPADQQPATGLDPCPAGAAREIDPVLNIHIGVVSSSLGGHGADSCGKKASFQCGGGAMIVNSSNDDGGHLLTRVGPCLTGIVPTYDGKGFLAWDPTQAASPPGEANIGTLGAPPGVVESPGLVPSTKDLVVGAGEIGCLFESQLESWYRFLVDPEPYASISVVDGAATPDGIDEVLLQERKDFLRPDSVLVILLLSDENDCSIKEFGPYFKAAQTKNSDGSEYHLPRPRSECAKDPNDPCCKSCGDPLGACPADPTCVDGAGKIKLLNDTEDLITLRCWDQKRRFGTDFLYEIDRYVNALTGGKVPNRAGELVENRIFAADSFGVAPRDKSTVFFGAVVGVPWQDIARDPSDLAKGIKGYDEMLAVDANGLSTWDVILGDPSKLVPPADPHMVESAEPRAGVNPITGDVIQPPSPTEGGADAISGHEFTTSDELQYACIFKLPKPRDCAQLTSCQCFDSKNVDPICAADASGGRTSQTYAQAYPGLRELSLIKALGPQGLVGSICPRQLTGASAADYAYRPFIESLFGAAAAVLPRSSSPAARIGGAPAP